MGDEGGYLVIDDTALLKNGSHSVGVAAQYASSIGKMSNCQSLVSVTLASREVPVMAGLRLFLPESWTNDVARMDRARVPQERQVALTKPEIAIEEIDRVIASGTRFRCVLADAGYVEFLRFDATYCRKARSRFTISANTSETPRRLNSSDDIGRNGLHVGTFGAEES